MHEVCIPSHARGVYPIPCTRCVSHTVYIAHENSNGEAKERNIHKMNSKRVVRNLDERNVGTKGKNPKQGPNYRAPRGMRVPLP